MSNANGLESQIKEDIKNAMREKKKDVLGVLRLLSAEMKQIQVDQRQDSLSDDDVMQVLTKMVKQRKQSIEQYEQAGRDDLASSERFEIDVLSAYLPEQLAEDVIDSLIAEAINQTQAASVKDMGKLMGVLKPQLQGKADMGVVGQKIKQRLGNPQ